MKTSEFEIQAEGRKVTCVLAEPDQGKLAADPALVLTFAGSRSDAMKTDPYNRAMKVFVEAGHRALSFDLPHHGDRIIPGKPEGIDGFRDGLVNGVDWFRAFVVDGQAAIDAVLAKGLTRPGRIFAVGISRGGYCALRLAAADPRVQGVGGIAPVVDWRRVREFQTVKHLPEFAALALDNYAEALAGRCVYLVIGNADARVGSDLTAGFIQRLLAIENARGITRSRIELEVTHESDGHGLNWRFYAVAAEKMLVQMAKG